jgi:hypothetical protein
MPIQFVGHSTATIDGGAVSVNPRSLTGGIDTQMRAGDFALLAVGNATSNNQNNALSIASGGGLTWTATTKVFQHDLADMNFIVFRALAATAPTGNVTTNSITNGASIAMLTVWRGIDPASPLDTAIQITGAINGAHPNPPAGLAATMAGCVAVVFGANACVNNSAQTITSVSSGYTLTSKGNNTANILADVAGACGYLATPLSSGQTVDPGAYVSSKSTTSDAWGAATVILRPAPSGGNVKAWTGSAFVAKPVKVWSGSQWVAKPLKRWNGTAWVTTNY